MAKKEKAQKSAEQSQKLQEMLKTKGHLLFVAGLGVLLLIRVAIYLGESGAGGGEVPRPPTTGEMKSAVSDETYKAVNKLTKPWKPFNQSEFAALGSFNIFDPKLVRDAAQIEKRASEMFDSAMAAYNNGRLKEAGELADEALSMMPSHARAQKLKKDIQKLLTTKSGNAVSTGSATQKSPPPAGPSK